MKKVFLVLITALLFNGCLLFQKVSYEITLTGKTKGYAEITFHDIKSDAIGNREFEEDKTALFDYMLKSDDFIQTQADEGKEITARSLFVDDDKLIGKVIYNFTEISTVEGIQYQDGFYFLTLSPKDSIISTNGQIVTSKEYKRIIWDNTFKTLKFEMLPDVTSSNVRDLKPFLKDN
jgi:hypothetical protein